MASNDINQEIAEKSGFGNESDSMTTEELTKKLKAALHYSVANTCQEVADRENIRFQKNTVAVMTEAAWKYGEILSRDLELFAKHAKRTNINADDVKMMARKNPKLLAHINKKADEYCPKKKSK